MINFFRKFFGIKPAVNLTELVEKGAMLVDVRTTSEFAQGSVPGAINIPLDSISSKLHAFENAKAVIVFCASGMRSSQAKLILQKNEINNVINGGTWQKVNKYVV